MIWLGVKERSAISHVLHAAAFGPDVALANVHGRRENIEDAPSIDDTLTGREPWVIAHRHFGRQPSINGLGFQKLSPRQWLHLRPAPLLGDPRLDDAATGVPLFGLRLHLNALAQLTGADYWRHGSYPTKTEATRYGQMSR